MNAIGKLMLIAIDIDGQYARLYWIAVPTEQLDCNMKDGLSALDDRYIHV